MPTVHTVFPGPIRQNAYLVTDLDDAIARWVALGIGPWFVLRALAQTGSEYRGQATAPVVSIAFANSGALQLELIHQLDDAPSIYREFVDAGRIGFHHVAFWSDEFDATIASAATAGFDVVHRGNAGGLAEFAYVDAGGTTSTVVEVMELNDATRWLATTVHDAAVGWDGTDAVRALG